MAMNPRIMRARRLLLRSDMRFLLWVLYLLANWLGLVPDWLAPIADAAVLFDAGQMTARLGRLFV